MKKFKKILKVLVALIVLILIAGFVFTRTLKPTYKGTKTLTSLTEPVNVYYDNYGIPHIYANNEEDAFRALGYAHAQDRLWQMELLRRIASGRISEVFGEDMIKTDKFFLALGIDEASKKTVAKLDGNSPTVKLTKAYLDGINQFIDNGPTPIEYYLMGIDKSHFVLEDVYNSIGYMAFSFAMAHKTDPLLSNIQTKLGNEYLTDLEIDVDVTTELIKNNNLHQQDSLFTNVSNAVTNALKDLPIPQLEGSNSWVISPQKTKNGHVIFANDPHIGFAQPSVWYEAHVVTPTYEKYGYHLAGIPFPLLGHDRNLAYGMTMFENDDIDFYAEENHPTDSNKYKTPTGWKAYQTITKNIKVKGGEAVAFSYKVSGHGPLLNGIANEIPGETPIAMSWIYTQVENKMMDAIYQMSHTNNIKGFEEALALIHAPGLNIMYGDAKGNIAWWATGKLYRLPTEAHSKFVLNGSSGKLERIRYLDFTENPQAVNPPWGYTYSANNQPDSISSMLYPGYYLPENRAKRIVQLLAPKNDWDKEAVGKMITDVTSSVNPEIAKNLVSLVDESALADDKKELLNKLTSWDGEAVLNSVEPSIFHKWIYYFLEATFKDELGEELFLQFLKTHFHKRLIAPMAAKDQSVWWDNVSTTQKETKQHIVQLALNKALQSLEKDFGSNVADWTWDKLHTLEHRHPIGQVAALRSFFNVGPFPVHGTREVINNLAFQYDSTGYFKVTSGPSTRRVIDFSDVENSISILPTGQSGNPFSKHYEDQAEMYANGKFRKMLMNKEEIKAISSLLTLNPSR
jgi:penicillin amidase